MHQIARILSVAIVFFTLFGFAQPTPVSAQTALRGVTSVRGECVVVNAYESTMHCLEVSEQREVEMAASVGVFVADAPSIETTVSIERMETAVRLQGSDAVPLELQKRSVIQNE